MKTMEMRDGSFGAIHSITRGSRRKGLAALTAAAAGVLLLHPLAEHGQAQTTTNGTWLDSGTSSANWSDPTNWVAGVVAGSTTGSDTGTALFNTSIGTVGTAANPIVIDQPTQYLGSIIFDNASDNYTIGTAAGNSLYLNGSATLPAIQINSTIANQSAVETINAPINFNAGNNSYAFNNATTSGALNFGGTIQQSSGQLWTLNLNSSSSQVNTLSGNVSDGPGGGQGSLGSANLGLQVNSGTWALSGSNTYTGPTNISAGATLAVESNNAFFNTQSLLCPVGSTIELLGDNLNVATGITNYQGLNHSNNLITYISNIVNPSGNNTINVNIQNAKAQPLTINCSSGFLTLANNSAIGTGAPYIFEGAGSGLTYMSIASSQNLWTFNSTGTWNLAAGSLAGQHGIQFPGPWNVNSGTVIVNDATPGGITSTSIDELSNSNHFTIFPGATLIETPGSSIGGGSGIWNCAGGTLEFLGANNNSNSQLGGTIEITGGTFIIGSLASLGASTSTFEMSGGTLQGVITNIATNLSTGTISHNFSSALTTVPAMYNFSGGVSILLNNVTLDTGNQPLNVYNGIYNTSGPLYNSSSPAILQLHRIHIDDGSQSNVASGAQTFTLSGPGTTLINGIVQDGAAATALPGTFVDDSTGSVTLNAANTYSGGTVIGAGVVTPVGATTVGTSGPLGIGGVTMGNAFTTTNNTSPTLYLAGNTLPNPITVANDATTGTYTIGSVTDQSSVFSGPITLNQPLTVTMITSQFFSSLSLSGGITSSNGTQTVTFAGPGSIYVSTTGITGAVAVNVSGGTTTLLVANGYTGPTNVVGGVLISGLSGAIPAGNNMTIGQGATFVADSQGTVSGLGSLNLNGNLDVQNGSLSTLTAEVAVGYNNGAWNGSGTAPVAITSSTAASDTTHLHAIGVIQNSVDQTTGGAQLYPTFEGQTVANTDVLVKYTYYGDANLSGAVDASDYSLIDNGYLNQLTGWYNGDFNYDGVVNGSDYTLIDNAYNMQGGQISSEIASATAQDASPSAVVPEPATLGLLGFSAVGLLHRGGRLRRRK